MPHLLARALGALLLSLLVTNARADELRVYAAASLTDAVGELAKRYERASVKPVFAASSTLAKQIDAGAPADVFISADRKWMDYLVERGRVARDAPFELLGNALVLIAPRGHGFAVRFEPGFAFADAFKGRLCTGEPGVVPVGIYAQDALTRLGWWDAIKPRVVGTDDVRAALAFVARGECPAGIVYRSDAAISPDVEIVGVFPEATHAPVVYPAAAVGSATPAARAFLDFLRTPAAAEVFARYGFTLRGP